MYALLRPFSIPDARTRVTRRHRVWYVKMRNNMQKISKNRLRFTMWHEFVGYVIHNCQPCMRFFIASFVQCSGRIMRYHTLAGILITCSYKYRPVATDPCKNDIQNYINTRPPLKPLKPACCNALIKCQARHVWAMIV